MNKVVFCIICCLLSLFLLTNTQAEMRPPAVAGAFYPADSAELAGMVRDHLENAKGEAAIDGRLIALIVPHAGLVYSGQIAAYSYDMLKDSPVDKVILCGPSHRYRFRGLSVYGPGVQWKTPLGMVPCDDNLCRQLLETNEDITINERAHATEHCLEVQLPYLQTVLRDFRLVPVVMGQPDKTAIELLTDALKTLKLDSSTIMIASTDWQHYRPAREGWKMDSLGIECLKQLDPDRLERQLQKGTVEACGGGPMIAVMRAAIAKGANRVKILKYGDSGDMSGDKSSVVGYVAAAIYKAAPGSKSNVRENPGSGANNSEKTPASQLSESDKTKLLEIARKSIETYLADGSIPDFEVSEYLQRPGAAFVTLKRDGHLRGCIGHTVADQALYKTVSICAIQAAVADSRFQPVKLEELAKLSIDISYLTPLQKIESLDEIEVGRDGLMLTLGNKRGLLLPQVATEYGWNRTEFLEQTCRKAGVHKDAYKLPDAVIYKFQALVFGE